MKALKKFTAMALPLFTAFSLATPAIAEGEDAPTTTEVSFTLNAHVEEYGQVINQIVINADALGDVTPEDFDNETFKVLATAYETEDPSVYAYEDVERTIASVDARYSWTWGSWHGPLQVTINLETAFGAAGQGTLNWNMARFSNLDTTQVYTITLNKAVGALQPENVVFTQNGNYTDAEVDAFTSGSLDGTNYRLFTPANANDGALHPLILWLHGGGEGGTNNSSQLRANRGALGFVTPEAQEIFGGAYVLAPQAQAGWSDAERKNVKRIIDFLGMENNIDANRIYVAGCSMGGYGTNNIVADYPDYFAAAVPICSGTGLSDEEYIAAFSRQNVFYVHAANDDTVTVENSRHFKEIIPTAEYAEYPDVNVDGVDYPGHWSWIWFDMNDPVASDGQHIFQWMASKSLEKASFTMKGKVFDWGEGINQITLSVPGVNFSRSDVSVDTFKVLATGVYGNQTAFSKAERVVESVSMGNGTITLNLNCDFGAEGAGTLLYTGGRNQVLNLSYDIVQTKDITLRNGTVIPTNAYHYIQEGQWTDDEVDQFLYGQKDAVPYRLFIPANADDGAKHPLMVWLHGAGESGNANEAQIRANRGALGWVTPEAQAILGGAFVLAPETSAGWNDTDVATVKAIMEELAEQYAIDTNRQHVAGCSMGGGGTMRIAVSYPEIWATVVPICAAGNGGQGEEKMVESLNDKEVWFIHAANDTTVNVSGSRNMHALLPNSHYTEYENNLIDGFDYPGHWSWIWFGNNDPTLEDGTTIFEWEANTLNTPADAEAEFSLKAKVYDWGEGINQVIINGSTIPQEIRSALSAEDFVVSVFGTNTSNGAQVYNGVVREVESMSMARNGQITLNLVTEYGTPGAGTLAYSGRNNIIDVDYRIYLKNDATVTFKQVGGFAKPAEGEGINTAAVTYEEDEAQVEYITKWTDDEVDQFLYGQKDAVPYRLYVPANADNGTLHPLLVWLHGAGESGNVNEAQIRANRGALGWVTPEAQEIFGGAFVLAPETSAGWNDTDVATVKAIMEELAEKYPIDTERQHVAGCSMGGGGTMRIAVSYPEIWATVTPICAAGNGGQGEEKMVESLGEKPVWFIHAENDTTVRVSGSRNMHALLPNSIYTEYPNNLVDGVDYPGHWSWIWFGNNDPKLEDGTTIFEWQAGTTLSGAAVGEATFTLGAKVYDWGEGVNTVTINAGGIAGEVDLASLTAEDFNVIVYGTNTSNGAQVYNGIAREVESMTRSRNTITLNLVTEYGTPGAGTLAYSGRNNLIDLRYQISLKGNSGVKFTQNGTFSDPEVDQFLYGQKDAVPYRLFIPANADDGSKHPLLVWLHGAGESGNNNEAQLRANRGALGWVTPEAQEIFNGAFVLAPETSAGWNNTDVATVKAIMEELAEQYAIDTNRQHVAGCSMGGGGTMRIAVNYPEIWATVTPICAAGNGGQGEEVMVEKLGDKEVWFIHAANDTTVRVDGSRNMHALLPKSHYTEYENNIVDGVDYPGHWSWIWFGNNDPKLEDGTTIFEWEAKTTLDKTIEKAGTFTLKGHVFDWGEGICQAVINVESLGLDEEALKALTPEDFTVSVWGNDTSNGNAAYQGVARVIDSIEVDGQTVTLNLNCDFGAPGAGTLAYSGRNNLIDLRYQITLKDPLVKFEQEGTFTDDEVDQFLYGQKDNVPYRLYIPENADDGAKHPLLLWLHGAGESGQNNEAQIRANRGALGWVTPEAQEIFGGAFVLAPETAAGWNDADVASVIAVIDELAEKYAVDKNRMHVAGCSMGGGGTYRIATSYPDYWATVAPICAAVGVSDEKILETLGNKPVWLIQAANDSAGLVNSSRRIHELLPDSIYTEYENNLIDGFDYPGHWSWIWFGNNAPVNDAGQTIFEWEAAQRANVSGTVDFELKAHVFDYGESICQVVLKGAGAAGYQGWTADDFVVRSTAIRSDTGAVVYQNVDRTVTAANIVGDDLVLDLACSFGGAGEGTLVYTGLNLSTDQKYEIMLKNDSSVVFSQVGNFSDDEVDAFEERSLDGVQYRVFIPENYDDGAKHPLLLWLHGAGERGTNNSSQIRANRGALGWTTPEAQEIFGGAFVVAPQSTKGWNAEELETVKNIIGYLGSLYNIDENRLHVAGCSMGGGGTTRIATMYPDMWATIVPICAAARDTEFPDDKMVELWGDKNVWFVHSAADTTVNPDMSSRRLHKVLPKSYYTEYPTVTIGDVEYYGHWSWIEFALNMPTVGDEYTDGEGLKDGLTIFEWEAMMTNEVAEPHVPYTGFKWEDGVLYWYEEDVKQGVEGDKKNIIDATYNVERGREIYDPETDAWYWLDANAGGAVARDKEVWMPYIFQEDLLTGANPEGKWVRYDEYGRMIKGWYANDNGTYYYDLITGAMYKGEKVINGKTFFFDELTGIQQK